MFVCTTTVARHLAFILACGVCLGDGSVSVAQQVRWSDNIEASLRTANASGKPVLIKFTADWCHYCKKMEKETFSNASVAQTVNSHFIPVLVDADRYPDLVKHLEVKGLPAILVVSPEMVILNRITGFKKAPEMQQTLNSVVANLPQPTANIPQTTAGSMPQRTAANRPLPTRPVSQTKPEPPQVRASFGGLCLPAVFETRSLVSGRPEYSLTYRGKTLYFSSAQHRDQFRAAPGKYWPSMDGTCPVTLAEEGRKVEGRLEHAAMFRGHLWVTADAEKMKRFVTVPARFVDAVSK